MMNILEYWDERRANAKTAEELNEIDEEEINLFYDESIDLNDWARERGIDLAATVEILGNRETAVQVWSWQWED